MILEQRIQNKLNLRKQKIQEAITRSRMKDKNPIAGYNLSAHQKKKKNSSKKCWRCGKNGHTRNFCPSIRISQIQRLVWELQETIETLEKALSYSVKKAEKKERNHKAKLKKKKAKKHGETVQAMNKAVTIHLLLLKDEKNSAEGTTDDLTKAMSLHQGLPPKLKLKVEKEYKRLFGGALKQHILEALDIDEAIEEMENMGDGPEETEMDLDT